MLYEIRDGSLSLGGKQILSHIDFEIRGTEKIGIVGKNGAGKTTLLRLIQGELSLDRDDKRQGPGILTSRSLTVSMLSQTTKGQEDRTVEELLSGGGPDRGDFSRERSLYEAEYDRIFTGFGFQKSDKKRRLSSFSGGEQTKIELLCLLLEKPDVLLLDEPTNHLDIRTISWLEDYMREYPKAVVFVSHDRFFLDQVTTVTYELRDGKLRRYPGGYTAYRERKQKETAAARKAYERQQQEIERLNGLIERFRHKPRKASFVRSRKTILDRMEKMEKPEEEDIHIFTGEIDPLVRGNKWVMEAEDLQVGYDTALLTLSLRLRNGQKIGIIGDNGAGKTAFLRTVAGLMPPVKGKCVLGDRITIGYFDQNSAMLESDKTVAEYFHDQFPSLTEKEVRHVLGMYLFRGKAANTRVRELSGGEKSRLSLMLLLFSRPNLLILDEPTNHMDIQAKETLESAFRAFTGTILFVSHDRYFLKQVADAVLVFEGNQALYYPFGYEHYLERKKKSSGGEILSLVRSEDQALIASLRAVPEKERHRLREIGTEEARSDWEMRLCLEELEKTAREAADAFEALEQLREEELLRTLYPEYAAMLQEEGGSPGLSESRESIAELEKACEEAMEAYTRACLAWWDVV